MKWFKKDKQILMPEEKEPSFTEQHRSAIEIVAHKNATQEAKMLVDEANAKLQEVFERNHFTVKIYLAKGGKTKQTRG